MSKDNTYTSAIQGKWLSGKVALGKVHDKEVQTPIYTFHAGIQPLLLKGLDLRINQDKPAQNFRCNESA